MRAFINTVCIVGLMACVMTMIMLFLSSLAAHDYHVVLTVLILLMGGFFIATSQVING